MWGKFRDGLVSLAIVLSCLILGLVGAGGAIFLVYLLGSLSPYAPLVAALLLGVGVATRWVYKDRRGV